jgi:hypothetical protein
LVVALDGLTVLSGLLTKKSISVGGRLALLVSFSFLFCVFFWFSGFLSLARSLAYTECTECLFLFLFLFF